jgi:class 3 adenylate cyclase
MTVTASELPTGTVTFLLTDIEGSTELVARMSERWPEVAAAHGRLLRAAVAAAQGHVVDARGEEFLFAFRRAQDAVAAAAEAQRALAEFTWPSDGRVRVRMGLHTGEPAVGDDGGYLGLDVHRVARICAAGHGGQVLCSATTHAILAGSRLEFLDLGEQQLKGLERAERIFQLRVPGLPREFAPLRSAAAAPFEGSERELGVAALARVRARVGRLPSLRRRPPVARRAADLCFALRATLARTPDNERGAVADLARAFLDLSRVAGDAERYLARIDRRALAKKLTETRELGVLSKRAGQAAARLEGQLALVDAVAHARQELEDAISGLEQRATATEAGQRDALRRDVDTLSTRLSAALDDGIQQVGYAAERLRRTRRRGIFRQGEVWVVRHYDTLGVEHLARFHALRDARAFRKSSQVDLRNVRAAADAAIRAESARPGGGSFTGGGGGDAGGSGS